MFTLCSRCRRIKHRTKNRELRYRRGGEHSLILFINDAAEGDTRCHGCFSEARCMSLGVDFAEDDIASTNNHFSEVFSGQHFRG